MKKEVEMSTRFLRHWRGILIGGLMSYGGWWVYPKIYWGLRGVEWQIEPRFEEARGFNEGLASLN